MTPITPERWERIKGLFHATLEHEHAQRTAFLAEACAGDGLLRIEVESLLASHEQAESFIETPASDVAAELLAEAQPGLLAGQMVGPFRIAKVLAAGGMGEVYLADDTRLGRKVALKLLPPQFTVNADRVRRFGQEARSASALNHPNIVTIHEIGESDSLHFIATEFVDGETLREHMAKVQMKLDEVLNVATQIASALAAAHAAGIVHRDIKPENVMIRLDGYVKVLDFGLAKLVETKNKSFLGLKESTQSATGLILGTVNYMSPEQAKGERVDERTDIFSFGAVIYEMLAGRTPFAGDSTPETFANLINAEPQPLSLSVDQVPDQLALIVSRMLRKNKDERYQTMKDVLTDLKSLQVEAQLQRSLPSDAHGRGTTTTRQTADVARARPTSSAEYLINGIARHRQWVALAAAALVLSVAGIAYFSYPRSGNQAIGSIAVLPFVNVSADPNAEYLSDGISDGIINSLSRLPNLKVNSLTSVLRYKGRPVDAQTVGRDLNVRAVLVGRLTKQGDDLAISAELVDVMDNRRLWGGQYSRKLSNILSIQDDIAQEISEKLRLRLNGEEKKQLAKQHTENNDAYLHYNLGNYYFRKNTKEGFEKSIESFEQAIKLDANYALAYVGLGGTYQFMGTRGFTHPKEYEHKIEAAALKALQLDDTLTEAHCLLAWHKFSYFDWAGAENEIKRALELNPNSSSANSTYFYYMVAIGRAGEGLRYAIRSKELDSNPNPGEFAFAYFLARQYDKAIESFEKNLEKNPNNAHAHILLGEAYVAKGMPAEGVAEMQKGLALDASLDKDPERWDRYPMLAYAYAVAGQRDEALKILVEQQSLAKQRFVSPYNFAIIYTALGDKDQAFQWLTKSVEQRTRIIFQLKSRPMFDPLRSDPRYAELLRRMNLEP